MSTDPNAGARRYLLDFLKNPDPGFAILISAPWGAGKTHFVNSITNSLMLDRKSAPLMVSLFGAASKEDIERSMLLARLPLLDNAATNTLAELGAAALKLFRIDVSDAAKSAGMIGLPETLIFDDLERATLDQRELLGFLNRFVERDRKRVILIANEERLWETRGLAEKEKLVGRTLQIKADFDAAFEAMAANVNSKEVSLFLQIERATINSIFRVAGHHNLRSLQQAIWEFERFFTAIGEHQKKKPDAMRYLLGHFLALTLEHKAGELGREDMEKRQNGECIPGAEPCEVLVNLDKKHGRSDFAGSFFAEGFPRDFAVSLICDGRVEAEEVESAITSMSIFFDPEIEEDWQTLFWALQRDDEVVQRAAASFNEKFDGRHWADAGIILHVFACRLRLSEIGLIEKSFADVEFECQCYIDDLRACERLEGGHLSETLSGDELWFRNGYDHLGYPNDDAFGGSFRRLFDYLLQVRSEVRHAAIDLEAVELPRLMSEDSTLFRSYLCQTGENDGRFARSPVLTKLCQTDFVVALLDLPLEDLRRVFGTLKTRHERDDGSLATERNWIKTTVELLRREASARSPLTLWRINQYLKHYIDPLISAWDTVSEG